MSGTTSGWPVKSSGSIGNTLTLLNSNAARVGGWYIYNGTAAVAYIQFFDANQTTDVTLGTTAPTISIGVPAGGGANLDSTNGIRFIKGIVIAITTTRAGSANTASTVDYNIWSGPA